MTRAKVVGILWVLAVIGIVIRYAYRFANRMKDPVLMAVIKEAVKKAKQEDGGLLALNNSFAEGILEVKGWLR